MDLGLSILFLCFCKFLHQSPKKNICLHVNYTPRMLSTLGLLVDFDIKKPILNF
jgi:hypothetical protein